MPGMSLSPCICFSWRPRRPAAAVDVGMAGPVREKRWVVDGEYDKIRLLMHGMDAEICCTGGTMCGNGFGDRLVLCVELRVDRCKEVKLIAG